MWIRINIAHFVSFCTCRHVGENSSEDTQRKNVLFGQLFPQLAIRSCLERIWNGDLIESTSAYCLEPSFGATREQRISLFGIYTIVSCNEFIQNTNNLRIIECLIKCHEKVFIVEVFSPDRRLSPTHWRSTGCQKQNEE
jgi:hypothetical protein